MKTTNIKAIDLKPNDTLVSLCGAKAKIISICEIGINTTTNLNICLEGGTFTWLNGDSEVTIDKPEKY